MADEQQLSMVEILDSFKLVWKKKVYVLLITIFFGLLALLVSITLPDIYESFTVILIEKQKVPENIVGSAVTGDVSGRVATIKQQILSRTNIKKIIKDFKLDVEPANNSQGFGKKIIDFKTLYAGKFKKKLGGLLKDSTGDSFGLLTKVDPKIEKLRNEDKLITLITKNILVTTTGKGQNVRSFKVAYQGENPETVKQIANRLASNFIDKNLKLREKMVEGTSEFLEHELLVQKQVLEKKESALSEFKKEHMGSLPEQLNTNLASLSLLQKEQASVRDSIARANENRLMLEGSIAQLERSITKKNEFAKAKAEREAKIKNSLASFSPKEEEIQEAMPILELEVEVNKMKSELDTLKVTYKDTYPDIKILELRLEKVENRLAGERKIEAKRRKDIKIAIEAVAKIEKIEAIKNKKIDSKKRVSLNEIQEELILETDKGISRLKNALSSHIMEINTLRSKSKSISRDIRKFQVRIDNTPLREQEISSLIRDYQNIKKHYQALLSKKLDAKISENLEKRQKGEQFRVLDSAFLPIDPIKPDRMLINIGGWFFGLFLGSGIFLLFDLFSRPVRRVEDFAELLNSTAFIVTVPDANSKAIKRGDVQARLKVINGDEEF